MRQALGAAVRWRFLSLNPAVRRRREPAAARRGARPVHPRRDRQARRRTRPRARAVCDRRRRNRPTNGRAGRARAPRRAGRGSGGAAALCERTAGRLSEDGAQPPPDAAHRPSEERDRHAAAANRLEADLPGRPGRPPRPRQLPSPRLATGGRSRWRPSTRPYHLRHTFATEALAAGSRSSSSAACSGASVAMIDRTYGHYARDSEAGIFARLNARNARSGDEVASPSPG
jgi:hypothetical protein